MRKGRANTPEQPGGDQARSSRGGAKSMNRDEEKGPEPQVGMQAEATQGDLGEADVSKPRVKHACALRPWMWCWELLAAM